MNSSNNKIKAELAAQEFVLTSLIRHLSITDKIDLDSYSKHLISAINHLKESESAQSQQICIALRSTLSTLKGNIGQKGEWVVEVLQGGKVD
ncbi:MAG: hypothetical protein PQ612_05915 [Rickettsiales bacterium]|nr:hypothetical protein [Pseudomonadota bacterium]MDA0966859.1 hypothetical protein [Pseudomonadota bacterium]MDG4543534.1 hypothetical protein [Rickettsiales bacterium]MDG4545682.1 hypothetical protein [Rickettsiales bacterium]MDG4547545.1 hypothetical protein [Rickettsiales bacterium]